MLDIEQQLKHYKGDVPLLLSLKEKGKLTITERIIAGQLLSDKSTQIQINSDSIDWTRFRRPPLHHHKESISWLKGKQRAILADDMGLGKTFSSIWASMETNEPRKLVLCPKHLMTNWKREIQYFTDNVTIIKDGKEKWNPAEFTIMNYEKIGKYLEQIREYKIGVFIADEAHVLKNYKTLKAKSFGKLIARSKARVWLLTGTPIANRPRDYYNLLKICRHPLTVEQSRWRPDDNAWIRFGKEFCNGKFTGFGWDFSGASNTGKLFEETKEYILRRTKETHLDLPDKTVSSIYLGMPDPTGYKNVVKEAYQKRFEESKDIFSDGYGKDPLLAEMLVTFSIIRKFLAYEKIEDGSTLGLIEEAVEQGKKVVVFTNYRGVIDKLMELLGDYEFGKNATFLDGRIDNDERQARVDKFQNDPTCRILICNYKVGKVGWNMTAGRVTIMNDIDWSPEANMQAQDRIYRIGQLYAVNIQYPIYENTIETLLYEILMLKIQVIKHAVDGIPMTENPERLKELTDELFTSIT